ncbi:MAG TPA: hypothetical protein VER55_02940 [Ardenticatenaceae bacterium]|nr:hypothetical protein [Ardenticatenaceae bacterium]
MILIDKENRENDHIFIISKVEECWDEQLSFHVMRKVQEGQLKASSLASVLSVLLDQRHAEAKAFAESLLAAPPPTPEDERWRAILVAGILYSHVESTGWSTRRNRQYTPKDEERLSDKVKQHLQQDLAERGIVVNREIQIRRGVTPGAGERTDIHVDAVTRGQDGAYDTITVIIETKGNWHDELLTAMETQLVNRYLRDNQCRHGLYLVGWFNCEVWSSKPRDMTLEELQGRLDARAQSLSTGGLDIKAFVLDVRLR